MEASPMRTLFTASMFASLVAGIAACGGQEPPTPAETRQRLADDLGHVLHETSSATMMSSALPMTLGGKLLGISLPGGEGFDDGAAVQWLDDHVFTDANHLGDGIYRVPADVLCTTTTIDGNGTETTGVDAECAQRFTTADVRVRVEADGEKLRFAIQVDADHDEPLLFILGHDELTTVVDLDSAGHALVALGPVFGEDSPNVRLAGRVTASLHVLGTAHTRATLDVDRAISIAYAEAGAAVDGPDAYHFTSAVAHIASLELDSPGARAGFVVGLGPTTAHLPGRDGDATTDLDLPGATLDAALVDGMLAIAHISLGTRQTRLLKNGVPAITIDVDPEDDRAFGVVVMPEPGGFETMQVWPRLDVRIATDHAALGDTAGVYDVTRVLLDGIVRGDGGDMLEVRDGTFSIATDPAAYGFTATGGQCVTESEATTASGDVYTAYGVSACK
jgi:hypothetical protein